MSKTIDCEECISLVKDPEKYITHVDAFTRKKDKGGLNFVTSDVFKVLLLTDSLFRQEILGKALHEIYPYIVKRVTLNVCRKLGSRVFIEHSAQHHAATEEPHSIKLLKFISSKLCTLLLHNTSRIYTDRYILKDSTSSRHKLNKTIIFLGQ